ncbi:hypothetical protein ABZ208_32990 [Streptomyces sp. NPDC006208]|uniref:hypothetical protein n=1 Tax=Streptomyces sp. NPDC006208 TaxID=3156734 RepID=UPI0033B744D8
MSSAARDLLIAAQEITRSRSGSVCTPFDAGLAYILIKITSADDARGFSAGESASPQMVMLSPELEALLQDETRGELQVSEIIDAVARGFPELYEYMDLT